MTIDEAIKITYSLREKSNDYPDSTSEEYLTILNEINAAIKKWESELLNGTYWKELFTTTSFTISDGEANAPSDYLAPSALRINGVEYEYKRPEEYQALANLEVPYIYTIYGGKVRCVDDGPAEFDYYRQATTYSTGAETTPLEMSDPYFAIYHALAELYIDDENAAQAQLKLDMANERLEAMKLNNNLTPFNYQEEAGFGV